MVNIYQVTDTRWSNALTTYNAIWMDVNNGAGGAAVGASGSRLLKLTNNTTEVFGVKLDGSIVTTGTTSFGTTSPAANTYFWATSATGGAAFSTSNAAVNAPFRSIGFGHSAANNVTIYYGTEAAPFTQPWIDLGTNFFTSFPVGGIALSGRVYLTSDGNDIMALRNGGTAGAPVPQTFNLYNFYVGAADYERGGLAWSGNVLYLFADSAAGTGTARSLRIVAGSDIFFANNSNTVRWQIQNSTGHFIAGTDNTYDIGASGATRPRNIYVGTSYQISTTGTLTNQSILTSPASATWQHGAADTNTTTTALTSISNASPAVVTTSSAHNLSVGTPVKFTTTGTLPTGLTVGTQYYVSVVGSSTTYQVSATVGGASINTSGAGSGTHSMVVGPVSQYIRMQGAITGTDLVGAPTYILGSAGTGAGAGGSIIFQVAPASGSSGTQNSYATALTINSTKDIATASYIDFGGSASSLGWLYVYGGISVRLNSIGLKLNSTTPIAWTSSSDSNATADTLIIRDAANTLAMRNGTSLTPQNMRWYNIYTDASNGAWAFINAAQTGGTEGGAVNTLTFGSTGNGSGLGGANSMTKFKLLVDGTNRLDYNSTSANIWTSSASLNLGTSRLCLDASTPTDTSIFSDTSWLSSGLSGRAIIFAVNGNSTAAVAYSTLGGTGYVGGFSVRSAGFYSFLSGNSGSTIDTTITRTTTGVLKIASGTSANAFCGIQFVAATYASLPTAASAGAGARFYITDGTTSTFYATVSGTGANAVCVFSDGTQYRVG